MSKFGKMSAIVSNMDGGGDGFNMADHYGNQLVSANDAPKDIPEVCIIILHTLTFHDDSYFLL
jgi:hypothetical protein